MAHTIPLVVIVGGGFGGLAAARALRRAAVNVLLIDRSNHHVFQPLLIASPLRGLLAEHGNTTVMLGNVTGLDPSTRLVIVDAGDKEEQRIAYDYLVLATGATHNYFRDDDFAQFAPGLKSLADPKAIRNHILMVLEIAEIEGNPERRKALMTFVMVGAGPTGVEMASAIAVMVRTTLRKNFRRIDPKSAQIILVDMAKRPLGTFAEHLSEAARLRLLQMGVAVRLGKTVRAIDGEAAVVGDERIPSKTVIWTSGVAPSPAGKWHGCDVDRAGRVCIGWDLTVQHHPEIFVIGDTASLDQDERPLPGVAQIAMQQGRYAAKSIFRQVTQKSPLRPFRYFDKGNLAVVGKNFAVLQSGRFKMSGFFAWLVWALIHIRFLAENSLRFSVFLQWIWTYISAKRGDRLIIEPRNYLTRGSQSASRSFRFPMEHN